MGREYSQDEYLLPVSSLVPTVPTVPVSVHGGNIEEFRIIVWYIIRCSEIVFFVESGGGR